MTATLEAASTESGLATVLAELVAAERVPSDAHFFDDLGADSMVMARFCARVRKRGDLPDVSMKDVYAHPTIGGLATALDSAAPAGDVVLAPAVTEPAAVVGTTRYALCGALQMLLVVGYSALLAVTVPPAYGWVVDAAGVVDTYLRAVGTGAAFFVGLCALPIVAKWVLIGRWVPTEISLWSLAYVRFWTVKTLLRTSPMLLFVGSPLYVLYLRALGARIGRDVVILSRHVPVCTDLLTVGDRAVVRKDSFFTGYRARSGVLETGPVTIGRDAFVGEATVLDIGTSLGAGAQLGHASSLHAGQVVPAGEHRHGSPADARSDLDHRGLSGDESSTTRKTGYVAAQLVGLLAVLAPGLAIAVALLVGAVSSAVGLPAGVPDLLGWPIYLDAAVVASVLLLGFVLGSLLVAGTVPRLLNLVLAPDRTYRLYGFRYWCHRAIARTTNVPFLVHLFGDSAAITAYLRWIGYDLSRVQQTGSNFGLEVKHESPFLSSVGSGTMVADGLSIMNAEYSSSSFRLARVEIGAHSFLGNYVAYPAQARTGDDMLLATKVRVPVDGGRRDGAGLLGSPGFEIPRSVQRDSRFDHLAQGDELRRRLGRKLRHNVVSMLAYLVIWWGYLFALTVLAAFAVAAHGWAGASALAVAPVVVLAFSVGYFVLAERAATGFARLRPRYCSIYDPYFWWHERYWKLSFQPMVLDGTPFKPLVWRLLGVRIGRRVLDDGCLVMEKTLVSVGDDCALNQGSIIQPHSQEDGAFKSDHVVIGARCTLGTGSLVHYGTTMGDDATLAPDAFLMKGEEVPGRASWGGNPAREMR